MSAASAGAAGGIPPFARQRLRPVEFLLLGYLAISSLIALTRLDSQPAIRWVLAANLLYGALVFIAARPGLGPTGHTIRELYPMVLLAALYPAIDVVNGFGGVAVHDTAVRRWEVALFGADLSRAWWQATPSRFWSLVFHGAYFAYYPIVGAPLIIFLVRGEIAAARRTSLWVLATFLPCYLVFLLFPVAGPYYELPRPDPWFLDNPAARLVYATLERGSAYGAAFPSSHVAAALVATAAAFAGWRPLGWILLLPAILLTLGVVYCQMHYGVDALAGVAVAVVVVVAGWFLERRTGARG